MTGQIVRRYCLANRVIQLESELLPAHAAFADYAYTGDRAAEICCRVTRSDVERELEINCGARILSRVSEEQIKRCEGLAALRKIAERLLFSRVLLIHAAAVKLRGRAYLFIAPSGGGKSTHRRLWQKCFDGVEVISDDKPLVDMTQIPTVYGSPFGGKEGLQRDISAPLCGIAVIIKSARSRAVRLSFAEALPHIAGQVFMPQNAEGRRLALGFTARLARLPTYAVFCTQTESAALVSYSALCGGQTTP